MNKLYRNFELFEHKADVGIRGYGKTLEEAFQNGAMAMFSVMVNLSGVKAKKKVSIKCETFDLESLFVEWLNCSLAEAGIRNMVFSSFVVERIQKTGLKWVLEGTAIGDKLSEKRHEIRTEVKGATYAQLEIGNKKGLYFAQTVVDV